MSVKSVLNPEAIVGKKTGNIGAAKNFISGGTLLGSSVVSSAANKIIGFQRSSAVRPVVPDINSILNSISSSIINNVNNSIQTVSNNLTKDTSSTIENIRNEFIKNIDRSIITNKTELINYINKINVVNKKEFLEKINQVINETNVINENIINTKEELIQYVDNIFKTQDVTNLITNVQNNVSNNIQRIEGKLNTIEVEKINQQIIQNNVQDNVESKLESIAVQSDSLGGQIDQSKKELVQYVDNIFKTQDIKNIVNNLQNNTINRIQKIENEIIEVKQLQTAQNQKQLTVAQQPRDYTLNVETLVKNIIQSTQNVIQNIQRQTSENLKNVVDNLSKNYQQKVKEVDNAKPVGILDRFLKAYNTAIGFIQFFGNKKNMDRLRTSLSNLKASFTETFEVAKLVRQVIIKIVKQLSSLPKVSPSGGGGINLDVDVPGSPLKRAAPGTARRMGMGRMLKYGAIGTGAVAAGGAVVNALSDSESVQPVSQEPMIPQGTVDMFSTIVDRFSNAINSLIKQAEYGRKKQSSTKTGKGSGSSPSSPSTQPGQGGPPGESPLIPGDAPPEIKALMETISGGEGGPDSVNAVGEVAGLSNMTIDQAIEKGLELKRQGKSSGALGAYQMMPQYLRDRAVKAGFDPSKDKFSMENQTQIMRTFMVGLYGQTEETLVRHLQEGKLESHIFPKLGQDSGWPSLPGGSQPNVHTPGSAQRYAKNLKKYQQESSFIPQTKPRDNIISPAPQQAQQVARAQSISQPPPQQQAQVNIIPMDLSGGRQQSSGGGNVVPPPSQPKQGPTVPFFPSGNPENFLVLYSKMVYNIVDG